MQHSEHAGKASVTAGIPGLSPKRRDYITEYEFQQVYQRTCAQSYRSNEEKALASDGAIEDVTDWDQVVGIPLMGLRVISRLRKLNSNLWFEKSNSDSSKTGVYIIKNIMGIPVKQHICGMETDLNPEFSVRVVGQDGTPKGIIGGWRRVLMRLIKDKLITESGAFALFGPPSRDSENWARFTA
jgi:hypothetical protein